MELQEFIKNTLVSIKNGVHDANIEFAKQDGKTLGTDGQDYFVLESSRDKGQNYMTFDVAVTVGQKTEKSGGGNIKIAVASLGGGIDNISSQEHVSRIKFHIIPHITIG